MTRRPSTFTVRLGCEIARMLAAAPASTFDLAERTGASMSSVHRAIDWLRQDAGAPLSYRRETKVRAGAWCFSREWSPPTDAVEHADLVQAWLDMARLRRLLEADDVVAEVERLILAELWSPGAAQ